MAVTISDLVISALITSRAKGFYNVHRWDNTRGLAEDNEYRHMLTNEQLAHAFIELGEAADHYRKVGEFDEHVLEELADVFIVIGDLVGRYGMAFRFEGIVDQKLAKNAGREHGYGNARVQQETACCGDGVDEYHRQNASEERAKFGVVLDYEPAGCCGDPVDCNDADKSRC